MKRSIAIISALAVTAVPIAAGTSAAATKKNIVEVAAGAPRFSTLVSLVKKADLVSALSGTKKLTVFAPTNAAFAKLPKATLTKLGNDPKLLARVLEYHVVAGAVPASKVVKLKSAKTLEGSSVHFSVKSGHAYVNSSRIIKTDIKASNGYIHEINTVLTLPAG